MNRKTFIAIAAGSTVVAAATGYGLSDRRNIRRSDLKPAHAGAISFQPDEQEILQLASLAPSGHNAQPWFVRYLEPYHWIIGNDSSRWLPAVDPSQRETMLSIGTFIQSLEYAASSFGYVCEWTLLATTNQDERVMELQLLKRAQSMFFDIAKIKNRRTVHSGFLDDELRTEDLDALIHPESDFMHYLPAKGKAAQWINEQTIEANRIQSYRDPAQQELADWIRFSSTDAAKHRDGLTTGSLEMEGITGWVLRNFYNKASVMKRDFRERGVDKVKNEVSESAGWILITSPDGSVASLLETGRRMQRLFLDVRERNIALHPMTQILEEPATHRSLNASVGISESIQFILRTGYLKNYPPPVSLRRPATWFVRV